MGLVNDLPNIKLKKKNIKNVESDFIKNCCKVIVKEIKKFQSLFTVQMRKKYFSSSLFTFSSIYTFGGDENNKKIFALYTFVCKGFLR